MQAIVAVDQNWAIGREGKLLAHLSGDLSYFKNKTTGKKIIIGRKTLESFPGGNPLPNRENIVLSRDPSFARQDVTICRSVEDVLALVADDPEAMVCGGQTIYEQFLPYVQSVYVTKMGASFAADSFFPDLDKDPNFVLAWEDEAWHEERSIRYLFTRYDRVK